MHTGILATGLHEKFSVPPESFGPKNFEEKCSVSVLGNGESVCTIVKTVNLANSLCKNFLAPSIFFSLFRNMQFLKPILCPKLHLPCRPSIGYVSHKIDVHTAHMKHVVDCRSIHICITQQCSSFLRQVYPKCLVNNYSSSRPNARDINDELAYVELSLTSRDALVCIAAEHAADVVQLLSLVVHYTSRVYYNSTKVNQSYNFTSICVHICTLYYMSFLIFQFIFIDLEQFQGHSRSLRVVLTLSQYMALYQCAFVIVSQAVLTQFPTPSYAQMVRMTLNIHSRSDITSISQCKNSSLVLIKPNLIMLQFSSY